MSQQTSAAIAAIRSATLANSITPAILAQVLTLLLGDVDDGDAALNTIITQLTSSLQNVEGTVSSQGSEIENLGGSLQLAQQGITANAYAINLLDTDITGLSNTMQLIQQRTTLYSEFHTGIEKAFLRESDCMPLLTDSIDCVKFHHPRMMTVIKDGSNLTVDLTSIAHEQVQVLIECDSDCDLSPYMQQYNIQTRSGADFRLHKGNSYVLYLNRVIDVVKNPQYSTQNVEIYATLIKQ